MRTEETGRASEAMSQPVRQGSAYLTCDSSMWTLISCSSTLPAETGPDPPQADVEALPFHSIAAAAAADFVLSALPGSPLLPNKLLSPLALAALLLCRQSNVAAALSRSCSGVGHESRAAPAFRLADVASHCANSSWYSTWTWSGSIREQSSGWSSASKEQLCATASTTRFAELPFKRYTRHL
jgi:hypothetical protein